MIVHFCMFLLQSRYKTWWDLLQYFKMFPNNMVSCRYYVLYSTCIIPVHEKLSPSNIHAMYSITYDDVAVGNTRTKTCDDSHIFSL